MCSYGILESLVPAVKKIGRDRLGTMALLSHFISKVHSFRVLKTEKLGPRRLETEMKAFSKIKPRNKSGCFFAM